MALGMIPSIPTSALTYQQDVGVSFTFNSTLRLSLSSADLIIPSLAPGTAADSNIISINVATNSASGYTLNATVGNSTTFNTRDLIHSTATITDKFSSVDFGSTVSDNTSLADNTWAYSASDNGTTWSDYSGLPLYSDTTNIATIRTSNSSSTTATGESTQFKIAAKASSAQASGEYNNVINFAVVANPEPTPQPITCPANTICYAPNALDVTDSMGDQTQNHDAYDNTDPITSNMSVNLWPSNFQRPGYGFAGWNTALDGSGTSYGPTETITTGDLSTDGLALYAMWVPSAGTIQNWTGCSSLNTGDITALTDSRDNNTYAVAKLADGKCWMIENIRLGGSTPITLTPTDSVVSANTALPAATSSSRMYNDTDVQLNADNTMSPVTNMTIPIDTNIYSYGNEYSVAASKIICPAGWRIPTGTDPGDFYTLNTIVNSGSTSTSAGLMAYPINLLLHRLLYTGEGGQIGIDVNNGLGEVVIEFQDDGGESYDFAPARCLIGS